MQFDIETDGLEPTKIHCLSWQDDEGMHSTADYDEMRSVLMSADQLVGHNIVRYDLPVLKKLLGWSPHKSQKVVDTLALSWYIYSWRGKHGLESFGEDFNMPKISIDDWENLSLAEYILRCEVDVHITTRLWKQLRYNLEKLYKDPLDLWNCVEYLTFKMSCAADQERLGWRIDFDKANDLLAQLVVLQQEKVSILSEVMPVRTILVERKRPKVWFKRDGSLSALAEKWCDLMYDMLLPDTTEVVKVVHSTEVANPNSITQVKEWLFTLGWEPTTFEYHKNKETGEERAVEQIRKDGELCSSVKRLQDKNPEVAHLEGLTIINHRLAIFRSFVACAREGYVKATIAGFTNTLRFRHARPLVNLPSVDKPWGKEIRSCLIAPSGKELCGADMVSLEDTTKRHYMQPHDPKYVAQMSGEGFDPHLDLALHAGKVQQSCIDAHNAGTKDLGPLRKKYKVVNYSATYGVGATKLSRTMGITQAEASSMIDAFWDRNWAIQTVADNCVVRVIDGASWLLNPVSGIYHSLRYEKDRFSTLNQSTGVYCFDTWVLKCKEKGLDVIGQFHDEVVVLVKEGDREITEHVMKKAMIATNHAVNLNVPLGVDCSFGKNYAEIH